MTEVSGSIDPTARRPSHATQLVPGLGFRPHIEGLRALAILLVVGYHAGVPGFGGGFVGVDVFFVLSGYLITWLLCDEAQRDGTIDFGNFYSRRARRLLPALLLTVLVTSLATAVLYAPVEQRFVANTAVATASYLSNVYFAKEATDYHATAAASNPLLHTWSLSVEEQFYLVWPLFLFLGLQLKKRRAGGLNVARFVWVVLVVTAVSFGLSALFTDDRRAWMFFLPPARVWEFTAGALARILPARSRRWPPGVLAWAGLAGLALAALLFDETTVFPGTAALLPVVSTVLLLRASEAEPATALRRWLCTRPLQLLGRLSYSWYLWHWPVLVFARAIEPELGLPVRLALLAASLGMAALSYRWVESPIRHHPWLGKRTRRGLALALCITVFGVGSSLGWRQLSIGWAQSPAQAAVTRAIEDLPEIYAMGCDEWFYSSELEECDFGDEDAPKTAILMGDSHAGQWFSTVRTALDAQRWRLIVMTKSSCPMVDAPFVLERLGRVYTECAEWRAKALERVGAIRPDLVITANTVDYPFSQENWRSGLASVVSALSAVSTRVVMMRDTPRPAVDLPRCLARSRWRPTLLAGGGCDFATDAALDPSVYAVQLAVAGEHENVEVVDLTPFICPAPTCRAMRGELVLFRDEGHLSDSFAESLAGALAHELGG